MCSFTASGDEELDRKLHSRLSSVGPRLPTAARTAPAKIYFCGEFVNLIAAMVLEIHQQGAIT